MVEPLLFDDLTDDRPRRDRLLFFIYPDDPANHRMDGVVGRVRADGLTGPAVAPNRRHITLANLGDFAGFPPGLVYKACLAAANVSSGPFDVMFDEAVTWKTNLVLRPSDGLPALFALHEALDLELAKVGIKTAKRPWSPHVTLIHDAEPIDAQAAGPVRWTVREFALVHSLLGRTRHISLGRWPLRT